MVVPDRTATTGAARTVLIVVSIATVSLSRRAVILSSRSGHRRSVFPSPADSLIIINNDNNPDADLAVAAYQRGTVNLSITAFFVGFRDLSNFGGHATTLHQGCGEFVSDTA